MNGIKIGIIGLGTVGGGVYEIIKRREKIIRSRVGSNIVIKKAGDKRKKVKKDLNIPDHVFTTQYEDILNDKEISIVVVLTGNPDFAFKVIKKCFKNSKHVVTANKALLGTKWKELFEMARECGCLLYFEASVGSGIPVIQGINEGLVANRITKIKGILNGTTNYILTKMSKELLPFKKAKSVAVKEGFAEPDSDADITGLDAAHKIAILANLVLDKPVEFKDIYYQGIENILLKDIKYAKDMFDFRIKLISVMKKHSNGVEIRVNPALITRDDMLASVNYEYNGIIVEGDEAGEIMFYGKGAGRYPAASAVVSDIIYLAQKVNYNIAGDIPYIHTGSKSKIRVIPMDELKFQYYVRFTTVDEPGVLSKISGILGKNKVSIASCFQKGRSSEKEVPILMVTHKSKEGNMKKALKEIDALNVVKKKSIFIRIESEKESYG